MLSSSPVSHTQCMVTCVVTWLAENGADPNAYNDEGETPMHIAARTGHFLATAQLELRGGDLRLPRERDGKTATELEGWQGKVRDAIFLLFFFLVRRGMEGLPSLSP